MLDVTTPALALSPLDHENNPVFKEHFRIKIWNQAGGTIEVSSDQGKNWQAVGKVIYPTEKTNADSYAAAAWVPDGKVAATAVNAIHIRTAQEAASGSGVIFTLLPKEFLKPLSLYRSYLSPDSSIYTDIPAGQAIFGDKYSPFVGNSVLLARANYSIVPFIGYIPEVGDKIYLIVERPVNYPKELLFENKPGGLVTANYFTGQSRVIAQVVKPVNGVGRFEGGKYASVGRIRANHAGVIDVSTSRLGGIGGFQIVPAAHAAKLKYPMENGQWLVVGPVGSGEASLEGTAPLFKYFIKPDYGQDDLLANDWENKLLGRFLVEVKLRGAENWQPMSAEEFDDYDLTGEIPAWANNVLQNISHIRILFPIRE